MNDQPFESRSRAQRFLARLGLKSWAWSLRRLHCPVGPDALVLEVGSGGNPLPRANVLVDAFVTTRERHWVPLRADRPTVLAVGENLPFRDKAFDFVIACHVLEHSPDPDRFLSELQRVGKAGYIETPDAFMERINPYRDHRLEVTVRDGELVLRKKPSWLCEPDTVELYEDRAKALITRSVIPRDPEVFHARYYWKDRIRWTVLNPGVDASWVPPASVEETSSGRRPAKELVMDAMQWMFSQRGRNRSLDLVPLLRCVVCRRGSVTRDARALVCAGCDARFEDQDGLPCLIQRRA